jgi:hypothetical protein
MKDKIQIYTQKTYYRLMSLSLKQKEELADVSFTVETFIEVQNFEKVPGWSGSSLYCLLFTVYCVDVFFRALTAASRNKERGAGCGLKV